MRNLLHDHQAARVSEGAVVGSGVTVRLGTTPDRVTRTADGVEIHIGAGATVRAEDGHRAHAADRRHQVGDGRPTP